MLAGDKHQTELGPKNPLDISSGVSTSSVGSLVAFVQEQFPKWQLSEHFRTQVAPMFLPVEDKLRELAQREDASALYCLLRTFKEGSPLPCTAPVACAAADLFSVSETNTLMLKHSLVLKAPAFEWNEQRLSELKTIIEGVGPEFRDGFTSGRALVALFGLGPALTADNFQFLAQTMAEHGKSIGPVFDTVCTETLPGLAAELGGELTSDRLHDSISRLPGMAEKMM